MSGTVVDYSWARPSPAQLRIDGHEGVMRYLGWDFEKAERCLSIPERDRLLGAGLDYGLVWETFEHRPLGGDVAGRDDAIVANSQADVLGFPSNRPLHVAVDFEPTQAQLQSTIRSYFVAFAANSQRPIRPYGCNNVLNYLCGTVRISDRGWQCVAWSYGQVSPYAEMLQQYPPIMDGACDLNHLRMADWGQSMAPAPGTVVHTIPTFSGHVLEGTTIEIQTLLTILAKHTPEPSFNPGPIDGDFGTDTEKAVRAFQRKARTPMGQPLGEDGVVGKDTITALRILAYVAICEEQARPAAPAAPFPGGLYGAVELHPGWSLRQDPFVIQRIQSRLCERGFPVGPAGCDGIFGLATHAAAFAFQESVFIFADGLVGEETWRRLFG